MEVGEGERHDRVGCDLRPGRVAPPLHHRAPQPAERHLARHRPDLDVERHRPIALRRVDQLALLVDAGAVQDLELGLAEARGPVTISRMPALSWA